MIRHRQQAVNVGWQIDSRNSRAFIYHHIEESGVLVREAVMVLTPDCRGDQQIQGGDLFAPGQVIADRQPFGMLIEHRVDHVNEGLVGGKEAVASGQQVALEHSFHGVLA